eukprot:TRINITY_DN4833_c0_g1_i11.p1 TRINITY_DN4833_c0_g1~~TRINITY_DN4833_c0_g1_i11.p1  ORF type:complete len:308 (+),score=12.98 TRINITY_DN4833_c0_g1_i11:95-1018(+)
MGLALIVFFLSRVFSQCVNSINVGDVTCTDGGYTGPYPFAGGGLKTSGTTVTLNHNSGGFIAQECDTSYKPSTPKRWQLLGRSLSFNVNLANVGCACNLALYLIQMPAYNSSNVADPTSCGNYYCDANKVCGIYCPEFDIMEANNRAFQTTPHKCNAPSGNYYSSCDGGGCGQNVIRIDSSAYGPNAPINTYNTFSVKIFFGTNSGGQLSSVTTTLSQNGHTFQMIHDDSKCGSGYLESMTDAFKSGMTLYYSYWGSDANTMSWLDIPPCDYSTSCTGGSATISDIVQIGRAVQQECRDRSRMPSSA